jgi:pimeloyl-ACP methyl ester carboxylesterase
MRGNQQRRLGRPYRERARAREPLLARHVVVRQSSLEFITNHRAGILLFRREMRRNYGNVNTGHRAGPGAWADGSCWSAVIEKLQAKGLKVTAPQFPESSLADDVARLRQVLKRQNGPTPVVGYSYGGQIMTSLGADAPNVVGLVYIAAFGLDEGETIGALLAQGPPTPALAALDIDEQGFAWLPEDDDVTYFAADVAPATAMVMFAVHQALSA